MEIGVWYISVVKKVTWLLLKWGVHSKNLSLWNGKKGIWQHLSCLLVMEIKNMKENQIPRWLFKGRTTKGKNKLPDWPCYLCSTSEILSSNWCEKCCQIVVTIICHFIASHFYFEILSFLVLKTASEVGNHMDCNKFEMKQYLGNVYQKWHPS